MVEHPPLPDVKRDKSRFHTIEDHNYWIKRNGVCPYCTIGSEPVQKSILLKELK